MALLYDYKNTFDIIRYDATVFIGDYTAMTNDMGIFTSFREKSMFSLAINDILYDENDKNTYCLRIENQHMPFISKVTLSKTINNQKRVIIHYDNCILHVGQLSQVETNNQYIKVNSNCVLQINEKW